MRGLNYRLALAMRLILFGLTAVCVSAASATTDLEVTYIERNPKYKSYQGRVRYYINVLFTDDFEPYNIDVAYGLSGQNENTQRWPDPGETVTFTAHVYNRGTTTVNSFTYEWRLDDGVIGSGTYSTPIAAGGFATLNQTWAWDWGLHRIKFAMTVTGDGHPSNNTLEDYTNALGLFTFIDYGYVQRFKDLTPSVPNPTTDSVTEWLQLHRARMNDMLEAAGSSQRWRYDRLDFLNDGDPKPSVDSSDYDGSFPQRFTTAGTDLRLGGSGYYHSDEDIDYGLLHELGHQLGIIDLYRLDISPAQNQVNGMGYSSMGGLMHGCSDFISEHTALAMNQWYGKRRGYFGQYLFNLPAVNKLLLLDAEGDPLPEANVTIYQKIETSGVGERIPDIPKFTGQADVNGIYVIPDVPVDNSDFWADTGDVLDPNPFGYISNHGENGVFLIKVEKYRATYFVSLDILEFNIAYWNGQTTEATYTRQTAIGRTIQYVPPEELTELNAENWSTWAQGAEATVSDDTSNKRVGAGSIKMDTTGGFDTYLRYPYGIIAHWDLSEVTHINVWFYTVNVHSFQNHSPWIRLGNYSGDYVEIHARSDILNETRNVWRSYSIPLAGNSSWSRSEFGTPDITDVNSIEIHADTWDYGFQLWVDGLAFFPQPTLPGDVDGNGVVDGLDLTAVLTAWETTPGDPLWNPACDLDGNGVINGLDLTEVISNWTPTAAPEPAVTEAVKPGRSRTAPGNVRRGSGAGNVRRK